MKQEERKRTRNEIEMIVKTLSYKRFVVQIQFIHHSHTTALMNHQELFVQT